MTFDYDNRVFESARYAGPEDFPEDTYRTLTAVDSAVMVIDAAKGIEARTRKLFEVPPPARHTDRHVHQTRWTVSRDPFADFWTEIEGRSALDTSPMTADRHGRDFAGTYDLATGEMRLVGEDGKTVERQPLDLLALAAKNPMLDAKAVSDELALVKDACGTFDFNSFREGHLTPMFFGSALKNFGVKDLLDALASFAPAPRAQASNTRTVDAHENSMPAFVFKIQANMDPNHRDRIAFARLCSGKLRRGMKAKLTRTAKPLTLSTPQFFFAQDRALVEEAYAGDVVGIPNHGTLRIGDTLTEGEDIAFLGVPNFAPEILRRLKLSDPMKAKKLKEALQQMAEEGVVEVFRRLDGAPALVGVVGPLQLDVLKVRLSEEYGLDISFEQPEFQLARWIAAAENKGLEDFVQANYSSCAEDLDNDKVFLARNQFILDYTRERALGISFTDIKDAKDKAAA
jgi:peptide chain release factor 3